MFLKCPNLCGENVYLQLDSSKKYDFKLNQLIWKKCPKEIFIERTTLHIEVASVML